MAKLLATIKAVITRIIFGAHGFIAIWQVTQYKKDVIYWSLGAPIGLLFFEGVFTLAIKKNQEWRWFCPSVFLYLSSVVPAIWLLELDKVERRKRVEEETINLSVGEDNLNKYLGVQIKMPEIQVDAETWVTLIEQFLMLVLIIGRWMLPKGDLTRDQLSQLLLVYIGTAADIIEFFDSFKDSTIANEPILVLLTLGIWSWSLLQFTIVLSATRSRKPRGGGSNSHEEDESNCCNSCCCSIDVWGIALNIVLQDAPFLAFRLLIIIHYKIISYMNVFFTSKNSLVILLQLYRLYVVHSENNKTAKKKANLSSKSNRSGGKSSSAAGREMDELNDIYIISSGKNSNHKSKKHRQNVSDDEYEMKKKSKSKHAKKDTGYSTASSQSNSSSNERRKPPEIKKSRSRSSSENIRVSKKPTSRHRSVDRYEEVNEKRRHKDNPDKRRKSGQNSDDEIMDNRKGRKRVSRKEKEIVELTEKSESSHDTSQTQEIYEKRRSKTNKKKRPASSSPSISD